MKHVLRSTHENDFLVEIIRSAILLIWDDEYITVKGCPQFKKNGDFLCFYIENEAFLQHHQNVAVVLNVHFIILSGITILAQLGQLDYFLQCVIKGLLTSGQLDDIILASFRQLEQSQQLEQHFIDAASNALHLRQLDAILVTTAVALKDSANLGTDMIITAFYILWSSGSLNDPITSSIVSLMGKVSCIITFVSYPFICISIKFTQVYMIHTENAS